MKYQREHHPLFYRWNNMLARCYCKSSPSYKCYGARGITVDERWRDYPEGYARWITVDSETLTRAAWLRRLGVSAGCLHRRVTVYGTYEAAIRSFADKPLRKVKMPKRKIAA
jgi:hypothetical protein